MAHTYADLFDPTLLRLLAARLHAVYPAFRGEEFVQAVSPKLPDLALKARVHTIALALHDYLPEDYPAAVRIILDSLPAEVPATPGHIAPFERGVWAVWPLCTYVARYGLTSPELSLDALHVLTRRFSCEFALRHFLIHAPTEVFARLSTWTQDPSPHVRRLVSEGTRPYLPWGLGLSPAVAGPTQTVPLLKSLRNDPSAYVRRSVANHLNDLSRISPELVLDILSDWDRTGWDYATELKPHALRTLLAAGNSAALAAIGFYPPQISIDNIILRPAALDIGESLNFSCTLTSRTSAPQRLRVDYVIVYQSKDGRSTTQRVFRLRTLTLGATALPLSKTHRFRDTVSRTHYPGEHHLSLHVNGLVYPLGLVKLRSPLPASVNDDLGTDHTRYSRFSA